MKKLLSVTLITLGISLTITNIHAMGQNNNSSSDTSSNTTAPSNTQISPEYKEKLIKICAEYIIVQVRTNKFHSKAKKFTQQDIQNIDDEIFAKAVEQAISTGIITKEDLEKFGEIGEKNLDCDQK